MTSFDSDAGVASPPPSVANEAKRVAVIDTDAGVRWSLEKGLSRSGYDVVTASTVSQALRLVHEQHVDGIVMELLPEAGLTLDVLSSLVSAPSAPRLVCVSVNAEPHMVIECMRRGASDFLTKPFGLAEVRGAVRRALKGGPLQPTVHASRDPAANGSEPSVLVGISPAIQELRMIILQVAQTNLNCLICGESGVGKDIVAREIHRLSQRRKKPFVKVNCSALPEQLLESELFGYTKGAFTGAVTSKPGRFDLAQKGIIFLDEIADMYANLQAKILQVIEHKEFTKLGGAGSTKVDVQIIAATNADLEERTATGSFRSDLYFRLNEVCIVVPPLRERKEDIPLLMHHFIEKHTQYAGARDEEISPGDMAAFLEYDWPGNVRELESTMKRWLALGRKAFTQFRTPAESASHAVSAPAPPSSEGQEHAPPPPPSPEREPSPEEILAALEQHTWNRRKAAQALGLNYQALRRRIKKFGLDKRH